MVEKEVIRYAVGPTRLGPALMARSQRGLCALLLTDPGEEGTILDRLRKMCPRAEIVEDRGAVERLLEQLRAFLDGGRGDLDVPLDLRGTPFQQRVWQALQRVPRGTTCSYQELARRAGTPTAVRAVASACGANPVAILVPCHRILRQDGGMGGYRSGLSHKRDLLDLERLPAGVNS